MYKTVASKSHIVLGHRQSSFLCSEWNLYICLHNWKMLKYHLVIENVIWVICTKNQILKYPGSLSAVFWKQNFDYEKLRIEKFNKFRSSLRNSILITIVHCHDRYLMLVYQKICKSVKRKRIKLAKITSIYFMSVAEMCTFKWFCFKCLFFYHDL